jgi:hypothetical protein
MSPSQRCTSKISPIGLSVYMCTPLFGATQRHSKHDSCEMNTRNNRRIVGGVNLYTIHIISKENRRLFVPKISCFLPQSSCVRISDLFDLSWNNEHFQWYLRISLLWLWILLSSRMWRNVIYYIVTIVLEEDAFFNFWAEEYPEDVDSTSFRNVDNNLPDYRAPITVVARFKARTSLEP